eukprot:5099904-Prymnesium_polylepis.2
MKSARRSCSARCSADAMSAVSVAIDSSARIDLATSSRFQLIASVSILACIASLMTRPVLPLRSPLEQDLSGTGDPCIIEERVSDESPSVISADHVDDRLKQDLWAHCKGRSASQHARHGTFGAAAEQQGHAVEPWMNRRVDGGRTFDRSCVASWRCPLSEKNATSLPCAASCASLILINAPSFSLNFSSEPTSAESPFFRYWWIAAAAPPESTISTIGWPLDAVDATVSKVLGPPCTTSCTIGTLRISAM